ncbi:MAG: mechanosensitive ion channel, partial [Okeania sp. SIO2H7]|nr:mechanosensitive ion channel [Okeania sp. SIO2H7]
SRLLKSRVISQAITNRNLQDTIAFLTQYALTFLGLLIIFQGWGIDVSSLAILASALGVGIGFGLQNITNNFISGLIITFERPIQVGDFVKVGDTVGVVERIGLRSTEISTLDQVSLIVPNSRFLESEVLNWSHGNPVSRIRVPIGVAYGSNIPLLRKAILEVAKSHPDVLLHPGPQLWFQEFGDSSLNFDLFVWINEPRKQFKLVSELNYRIEAVLRKNDIEIPFPQRDLNLRSPQLEEAIALWMKLNALPKEKELFYPEVVKPKQSENTIAPTAKNDERSTLIEDKSSIENIDIDALVAQMRGEDGVEIKDRRYGFNLYPKCFVGSDAVKWLMRTQKSGIKAAISIGQLLLDRGIIHHVLDEHDFKNESLFYRFYLDDE